MGFFLSQLIGCFFFLGGGVFFIVPYFFGGFFFFLLSICFFRSVSLMFYLFILIFFLLFQFSDILNTSEFITHSHFHFISWISANLLIQLSCLTACGLILSTARLNCLSAENVKKLEKEGFSSGKKNNRKKLMIGEFY